jgi:hypothetical protein
MKYTVILEIETFESNDVNGGDILTDFLNDTGSDLLHASIDDNVTITNVKILMVDPDPKHM